MVKYYIENLDYFLKNSKENITKSIIVSNEENVIEILNSSQNNQIIQLIKNTEIINDKLIVNYIEENLPTLYKHINTMPIDISELKNYFNQITEELPENVFEGQNIIEILKKISNSIIKKIEIDFIIENVTNGKLRYDEDFKYKRTLKFYYRLIYLNKIIEEYYILFIKIQRINTRIFLKNIFYTERKISKKERELYRYIFNLTSKNILDFEYILESILDKIKNERKFIEKYQIFVTGNYNEEENKLINISESLLEKLRKERKNNDLNKKNLDKKYKENKGIFNKETINTIINMINLLKP